MTELIRNAWTGWLDFTSGTKLAALFLAALLYLWLRGKWKEQKTLYFYSAWMAFFCMLPLTAALLMLYQTRFYSYVWLWSLVPVTAVTAWAVTDLSVSYLQDLKPADRKRRLPAVALLLAVLILCGGIGKTDFEPAKEREERTRAREILTEVRDSQGGGLCLWAPREILQYAREFDGSIRLIYGRNMWDAALGAYTYDVYSDELQELYFWMENTDGTGQARMKDQERGEITLQGADCMEEAVEAGAECILLPDRLEIQTVEELAKAVDAECSRLEGYYLLTRRGKDVE